jgi:uncharacterized protein
VVRVKVLGVDAAGERISLTLRLDDEPGGRAPRLARRRPRSTAGQPMHRPPGGTMADALRRAGLAGDRPAKP